MKENILTSFDKKKLMSETKKNIKDNDAQRRSVGGGLHPSDLTRFFDLRCMQRLHVIWHLHLNIKL